VLIVDVYLMNVNLAYLPMSAQTAIGNCKKIEVVALLVTMLISLIDANRTNNNITLLVTTRIFSTYLLPISVGYYSYISPKTPSEASRLRVFV
jgi:hypothetical protein